MITSRSTTLRQNFLGVWKNKRIIVGAGLAHFTHDGFADMLYIFFPVWQAQFGLAFAEVGLFKMLFSGTLALFQVPASLLARRIEVDRLLWSGTLLTSVAMAGCGWCPTALALGGLLVIGGLGESVQHPLSAALIANAYTDMERRRTALSIFNVSGDLGKLLFPAAAAFFISRFGWPEASQLMGLFGVAVALTLVFLSMPVRASGGTIDAETAASRGKTAIWRGNSAFAALLMMGILDSATRMGFLTYFPFLLRDKGADIALTGLTFSSIFAGGIAGKFFCGILATRVGVLRTVLITECLTAVCIWATLVLPLEAVLVLCPILGLALNGTSSVLYGSVPELIPQEQRNHAFAVFYTATIGSGAISPILYGFLGDLVGLVPTLIVTGTLVLATLPLTLPLQGKLAD